MKPPWKFPKLYLRVSLLRHYSVMPFDTSDGGLVQHSYSVKGVIYTHRDQKSQLFLSAVAFSHFTFWEAHRKHKKCSVV